ncbi:MAG: VanZ family protein [Myxococcota bacterium]|jgi:VanZ family protein|nr:VanZ family protein [Myxococcota bacterium]MDP7298511.1 VanZ family protein [Myxococcota bacterium]MDP7432920.1 VanZ family protein [Myxococcota bacterium]HJO25080.1 VanZ family protein [Myxococcota bacterium]
MDADRRRGAGLLVACLFVLGAVLHAGLRPYEFFVSNGVSWSEGAAGLRFSGQGVAATSESIGWPASGRAAPLSIEVWLRRGASVPADGGVVLAVDDAASIAPLLLAQWKSSLYFRFRALQDGALIERTLSLGQANFPEDELRFVALASGEGGSRAYVEAAEMENAALSHPVAPAGTPLSGRLVLGSRIRASRSWLGQIEGLALYRRTLSAQEIASHAAIARERGVGALAEVPGLLALYAFGEGSGQRTSDLAGGVGDLVIPRFYRSLELGLLQLRPALDGKRVLRGDVVVNLVGFVPVGLLLVWALRRWTSKASVAALFWTASGLGLGLSLTIETIQAFLPGRVSSAGDAALNAAGTVLGALLAFAVDRLRKERRRSS